MFADLNFAGNKRHFALCFNRQRFRVGWIKNDVYNTARVLYAEIIFLPGETDAAAFVGLAFLAMQKSAGQQLLVYKAQRHGIGLEGNLRRGSKGTVRCLGIALAQPRLILSFNKTVY